MDGAKLGRPRPVDEAAQERVYDGRKHCHCFACLLRTNNEGFYTRINVSDLGSCHDRRFYEQEPPYVAPNEHFADGGHLLADSGFIGEGDECVCPFKKGMGLDFALSRKWNRSIRGVRMLKEWAFGYISNRHRIFLGAWPFDPDLFAPAFDSCAIMANEVIRERGYALQKRERYAEKAAAYEAAL